MKIIDAFWEKRNLGLRVCELIFGSNDVIDHDIITEIENSYDYLIAKIPGNSTALMHDLEERGFRYLENQQVIYFQTDQFLKISKFWKNRFHEIQCARISEIDSLERICSEIRKGLYLDGRISADPLIEKGISDLRIVNWLRDLHTKSSTSVYSLKKGDLLIGYFVLEDIGNNHLNIVQAGIFKEFQNKGFSFLLLYNILNTALVNGYKGIFASISTGNIKTLNSISRFVKFSVKDTFIVARKMNPDKAL